jgi:hypothetical protein
MVFVRPDFSDGEVMKPEVGFGFALPRLLARGRGREVRHAEWSGLEACGVGLLVFGINWVCAAHFLPLFVRPLILRIIVFVALPVLLWVAFLLLYYLVSLVIRLLRRFGLYTATTNDPIQHLFFVFLTTLLALFLIRNGSPPEHWLGELWLGLLALNLVAVAIEKISGRA